MAVLMEGTKVAAEIKKYVADEVKKLKHIPVLNIVRVGNDPASEVYIKGKIKDCEECGILWKVHHYKDIVTPGRITTLLNDLQNYGKDIAGILVQLPLPAHLNEAEIMQEIYKPDLDVDCFTEANVGKLYMGTGDLLPCTPLGIMKLLEAYDIDVAGKHCVIVGRSNIVGKPLALMMLQADATITVCHSKTANLRSICKQADILISAVGKAKLITADMVKPGAVVIDVAINRDESGKLCGDVDFGNVEPMVSYITPVPGGVGPMTRAALLLNVLTTAKKRG